MKGHIFLLMQLLPLVVSTSELSPEHCGLFNINAVVLGTDTHLGDYPWMATLGYTSKCWCSYVRGRVLLHLYSLLIVNIIMYYSDTYAVVLYKFSFGQLVWNFILVIHQARSIAQQACHCAELCLVLHTSHCGTQWLATGSDLSGLFWLPSLYLSCGGHGGTSTLYVIFFFPDSLTNETMFNCSGSVISERYVLTVALCVTPRKPWVPACAPPSYVR